MTDEGLVYFALDAWPGTQLVKIGTTTQLRRRMAAITPQTVSRQSPIVLALIEGGQATERAWHSEHAALRVRGEWFRFTGALADAINEQPHPLAWLLADHRRWVYADGWAGLPIYPSLEVVVAPGVDPLTGEDVQF